jgi:Fe-S-cluster containining protein
MEPKNYANGYVFLTQQLSMAIKSETPSAQLEDVVESVRVEVCKRTDALIALPPGAARAAFVNSRVSADMRESEKVHAANGRSVSCKAGCSACCHIQVSVTSEDAENILETVIAAQVPVSASRLSAQLALEREHGEDSAEMQRIPFTQRACIFLQNDGMCGVYVVRPPRCRAYAVVSPAEDCDTSENFNALVRNVVSYKAQFWISAQSNLGLAVGSMAKMFHAAIRARGLEGKVNWK